MVWLTSFAEPTPTSVSSMLRQATRQECQTPQYCEPLYGAPEESSIPPWYFRPGNTHGGSLLSQPPSGVNLYKGGSAKKCPQCQSRVQSLLRKHQPNREGRTFTPTDRDSSESFSSWAILCYYRCQLSLFKLLTRRADFCGTDTNLDENPHQRCWPFQDFVRRLSSGACYVVSLLLPSNGSNEVAGHQQREEHHGH